MLLIVPFALFWGGFWWRLRGGALTAISGFDPGTGGMRLIAAVALSAPLLTLDWHWVLMMPALWIAWSLAGWGAFQSAGTSPIEQRNWMARGLFRLGLTHPLGNDVVGMALEGALVGVWPAAVGLAVLRRPDSLVMVLAGLGFAPCYVLGQRAGWRLDFGRFARAGSEWGECFVGALMSVTMALVVSA